MENCPICQSEFKQVPAGVSKKTGQPYQAFIACSQMGCKGKPSSNLANIQKLAQNTPEAQISPNNGYVAPKPRNFEAENFGKCKHAFLVEAFKHHLPRGIVGADLSAIEKEAEQWAEMSMRKLNKPQVRDVGQGEEYDQAPF